MQKLVVPATALMAALLAVPATYALLRAFDVLFRDEPNPATVIASDKIAMFWRLGVGGYVAGMILFGAWFAARSDLRRTLRAIDVVLVVVAALLGVQGLLLP